MDAEPLRPEEPPIPPLLERPAGQPSAANWAPWMSYTERRREVAELSGLFLEADRDAYRHAWELVAEQLRQCVAYSREHNEQ